MRWPSPACLVWRADVRRWSSAYFAPQTRGCDASLALNPQHAAGMSVEGVLPQAQADPGVKVVRLFPIDSVAELPMRRKRCRETRRSNPQQIRLCHGIDPQVLSVLQELFVRMDGIAWDWLITSFYLTQLILCRRSRFFTIRTISSCCLWQIQLV